MFFVFKPADAMSGLPCMHQHLGFFRFITDGASESAVILMRMCQHNTADVGDTNTRLSESFMESVIRFFGFRARIDERDGIFWDQVDVNWANVERRRQRDRDDAHRRTE